MLRLLLTLFATGWLMSGASAAEPDLANGEDINGTCAGCHGAFGQGGKQGEYPRLAGLSARYIAATLKAFKARERINMPMYPYTQNRELPDSDIRDIAAYLSQIALPTRPPVFTEADDALARLQAMEKVMIIPRVDGDLTAGKGTYDTLCARCHGETGRGRGSIPMLVGQYSAYLGRQMSQFRAGDRLHDVEEIGKGALDGLSAADLQNVLAHLTELQYLEESQ